MCPRLPRVAGDFSVQTLNILLLMYFYCIFFVIHNKYIIFAMSNNN
nr:MAG TPA: hypothetical protein [Caudoviricetes sp.]